MVYSFEVHDNPEEALSDGPNMLYLDNFEALLRDLVAIDKIVKRLGRYLWTILEQAAQVLHEEARAIEELSSVLDHFVNAVNMILVVRAV